MLSAALRTAVVEIDFPYGVMDSFIQRYAIYQIRTIDGKITIDQYTLTGGELRHTASLHTGEVRDRRVRDLGYTHRPGDGPIQSLLRTLDKIPSCTPSTPSTPFCTLPDSVNGEAVLGHFYTARALDDGVHEGLKLLHHVVTAQGVYSTQMRAFVFFTGPPRLETVRESVGPIHELDSDASAVRAILQTI